MKQDVLLEAEGFQVLFEISDESDNFLQTQITLSFLTESNHGSFQIRDNFIKKNDLLKLAKYYENHILNLKSDRNFESNTFVTQEFTLQTKAYCGEMRDKLDGEFTISFMLNIGFDKEGSRIYAGCEALIILEKAQMFINSINQIANK